MQKVKKKKQWWTAEHTKAFEEYYFSPDLPAYEKEKIFNNILFPAYMILAHNIVDRQSWHIAMRLTPEELINDLVAFADSIGPKYDPARNTSPSSFLYFCMQRECYHRWQKASKRKRPQVQEHPLPSEGEDVADPADLYSLEVYYADPENRPLHYSAVDDTEFQVEWRRWLRQWGGRVFEGKATELKMLNYMLDLDFGGVEVGRHRGGIYNMLAERFAVSAPTLRLFIERLKFVSHDLYKYYYLHNQMPSPHKIKRPTKLRLLQAREERAKKRLIAGGQKKWLPAQTTGSRGYYSIAAMDWISRLADCSTAHW